jgi:hypothetical protein
LIFDFILEKPATRPRDRCGKEQLVYPFVTGFPGGFVSILQFCFDLGIFPR